MKLIYKELLSKRIVLLYDHLKLEGNTMVDMDTVFPMILNAIDIAPTIGDGAVLALNMNILSAIRGEEDEARAMMRDDMADGLDHAARILDNQMISMYAEAWSKEKEKSRRSSGKRFEVETNV